MTNEERLKAFTLRLSGMSWESVAEELCYTKNAVVQDMRMVMAKNVSNTQFAYPNIGKVINERYNGSVKAMALDMGISYPVFYHTVTGRTIPDDARKKRIADFLGMDVETAFKEAD